MQYLSPELLKPIHALLKPLAADTNIGIGLSAGADSAMLAVHAAHVAKELKLNLYCIHIHHGLQQTADAWLEQAQALAKLLGVGFCSARLAIEFDGSGLEAAARQARYQAINSLASEHNIKNVLLAHHLNDQAETVLFRLLRGAGPTGLAAMAERSQRGGITFLRPWLQQPRGLIIQAADQFSKVTTWSYVKDPTNTDKKYSRGVIRTEIAPVFDGYWPSWRKNFARHALQAQELSLLVDEIAQQDLQALSPDNQNQSFSLLQWRSLSSARQVLVIRYWLGLNQCKMPSQAWLDNCLKQLRSVHQMGSDRNVKLKHGDKYVVVVKGRVVLNQIV